MIPLSRVILTTANLVRGQPDIDSKKLYSDYFDSSNENAKN